MIYFLLREGADPDDEMALVTATKRSPAIVHLLLAAFAKRCPRGKRGYGSHESPALCETIEVGNSKILENLLKIRLRV
jgi:hypothetical protein